MKTIYNAPGAEPGLFAAESPIILTRTRTIGETGMIALWLIVAALIIIGVFKLGKVF